MINFITENNDKAFETAIYLLTKYGKSLPDGTNVKLTFPTAKTYCRWAYRVR